MRVMRSGQYGFGGRVRRVWGMMSKRGKICKESSGISDKTIKACRVPVPGWSVDGCAGVGKQLDWL